MDQKDVNQPLLSIIIPVYNVEEYLPDCIRSLMNQTMSAIEYIFVDDKSTDSSSAILQDACTKYGDRMRVIYHESNKRQGGRGTPGYN